MDEEQKQKLVDAVIEQIKTDINTGDLTAVDELLHETPEEVLIGFLPENEWKKYL